MHHLLAVPLKIYERKSVHWVLHTLLKGINCFHELILRDTKVRFLEGTDLPVYMFMYKSRYFSNFLNACPILYWSKKD